MASLRKAIDAHCKSCGYDPKSGLGGWKQQITDCPCTQCHLYAVRPRTLRKRVFSEPERDVECSSTPGDLL